MVKLAKEIIRFRLSKTGDASRPLGWKKVAGKLGTNLETVKQIRRSQEYYDCVLNVCRCMGIARLQAKSSRKNRSVPEWIENAFGLDIYSSRLLEQEIDPASLLMSSGKGEFLTQDEIDRLSIEADNLVSENTETVSLTRKHVGWLLGQGYAPDDRMLIRAAAMTKSVCSHTNPDWLVAKSKAEQLNVAD